MLYVLSKNDLSFRSMDFTNLNKYFLKTMQIVAFLLIFGAIDAEGGLSVGPPDDTILPQVGFVDKPKPSQDDRTVNFTRDFLNAEIDNYRNHLLSQHFDTKERVRRSTSIQVSWTVGYLDPIDVREAKVLEYFHCNTGHYLLYNWAQEADSFERETRLAEWNGDTFVDIGALFTTAIVSTIKTHFVSNRMLIAILNFQFAGDTYEGISQVVEFDPDTLTTTTLQNIMTWGASGADFFEYESETYLAITNQRRDDYDKFNSELSIYQYMGMHFDRVVSHPTSGASDVVHFEYEGFVYLVVGQFVDNNGNYDVGTAVYLFDSDNSQLKDIQILETSAVTDLEIFKINFEIYLAVANNRDSVTGSYRTLSYIYWWSGKQFVKYQSIPSFGAKQWRYQLLEGENSLLFLADFGTPECLRIFEFDDEGDWVNTHVRFTARGLDPGAVNETVAIETMEIDGSVHFLLSKTLATQDDFHRFFSNFFVFIEGQRNVTIPETDPLIDCHTTLANTCNQTDVELKEIIRMLNTTTLQKSGDQEAIGNLEIQGDVIVRDIFSVFNLTLHEYHNSQEWKKCGELVEQGSADIQKLQSQLPNLVSLYDDETIQAYTIFQEDLKVNGTLTGNISALYFGGTVSHSCVSALSGNTSLDDVAGCLGWVDIQEIDEYALHLEGDQNVTSHAVFLDTVTIEENITIGNELNGLIIPDDLLLVYSDQEVLGYITFDTHVSFQSSVEVKGQLNGLDVETDIVTQTQSYSIGGVKQFTQDVTMEEPVAMADGKTVDQVDLSEFETLVVTLDGISHIFGNITFENATIFDGDITMVNDLINEVNITELAEQVVIKNTTQIISGSKYFRGDLIAAGNVSVSGHVNNVDLSVEVVPIATTQTIHTSVRVENITSEESIEVQGTVNGINLSDDVVLTYGNQTVNGRVNFTQTVVTTGNLLFPSGVKIDTVDVSELEQTAATINRTQTLSGKIRFEEPVEVLSNVSVNGLINGINLSVLNDEALSKSKAQIIPSDLQMSANATFDQDLTVNGTVDGYKISDFIPLEGETEILGLKLFLDSMTVSGNVNLADGMTTNCADLSELIYEVLMVDAVQTLTVPSVLFSGELILRDDLTVEGLINGVNTTSDVVTLDGQQVVQGKKIFTRVSLVFQEHLNTTSLRVGETFQGEDVNHFFQNAAQININTWIAGRKYFGTLTLLGDLNVTGLVDGVDLLQYSLTVVTLDGNQSISGNWRLTSSVEFQDDVITESVNSVDIHELAGKTVYRNKKQDIYGWKEITGYVTVTGSMDVSDLINGLDLKELDAEYFSKSRKQTLKGRKIIHQSASLYNLFLDDGSLFDGVLPGDLAIASEDTNVTVLVYFDEDVKVVQDMVVGGLVNSVDLVQLNNSAVWRNIPETISGKKHFQGRFAVVGNITTSALVNGIDISELVLSVVNPQEDIVISVPVYFYGPVKVIGNWNMSGLFHSVDISFIMSDALLTVGDQIIFGDKHFSNPSEVSISHLEVLGDLRADVVTRNGASLEHLLNNTVTASTDQDIEGEVTFLNDIVIEAHVIVTGEIDGLDLSENAVLITGEQEITSTTHFKKGFTVAGNLSISGLVDTIDLEAFINTRFSLSESQVVEGKWMFREDVYMDDLLFTKKINDIYPATDPVYPDRNYTITGKKIFRGQVMIDGDADIHVVNGIDLYNISKIVLKHGDYVIMGEKTFASTVTLTTNITVIGLVDSIYIQQLWWKEYGTMSCVNFDLDKLDWQLSQLCYPAYTLQVAATGLAVAFLYFENCGEITNPVGAKTDVIRLEGASLVAISETHLAPIQRCISTELHICPDPIGECWKVTDLNKGSSSIEVFSYNGSTFIIATPSTQNTYCSGIGDTSQTVVYKLEDSSWNATLETPGAIETTAFVIDGIFYIAVANFKNPATGSKTTSSLIFQYELSNDSFSLLQEITTQGAESVASLDDGTNQWLAFANGDGQTFSKIYKWQNDRNKFTASASIRTLYASDVVLFSFEGSTYVFFSNKMEMTYEGILNFNQPVAIYQYTSGAGWMWSQYLESPQTVDLDLFVVNDIPYLVAVSHQGFINIFQWTYPSSFQFHISIPMEGVEQAKSFVQGNDLFMVLTQPRYGKEGYPSGKIKILKAEIRSKEENTKLETF